MERLRRALPVLLALGLLLVVFGKGMWEGTTRFLGREYVDAWGTQWFYWFVGRQVGAGEGFGHSNLFFYPWGKDIYLHTGGNVLDGLFAWPVRWLLGPVAGYNLFVLAIVATNLLAMRTLLLRLGARAEAATLAGVFFAFNPWVLHELRDGRPTQALLAFLLLFFADYLSLDTDRRAWLPARAGLWLALAGLTYWYNALFAGMAAALIALLRVATGPERTRTLLRHSGAGLVAVALVAPFALPMLGADEVPGLLDVSKWSLTSWSPTTAEGVDIGLYVFDPVALGSGFYAIKNDGGMAWLREDTNVFPIQVLFLVLGAVLAPPRIRRAALVLVAVSLVVATGPSVVGFPNVLYLLLVKATSIFQRLWWPSRALVLGQIGLAILLGFALHRMGRLAPFAALAAGAWWVLDLRAAELGPMASWDAGIPAGYRCLAESEASAEAPGAIVELPYAHTQAHLYYQTLHGRPLFGGMVEDNVVFAPGEQVAFQKDNGFVAVLLDQAATGADAPVYEAEDRAALNAMGYKWVVLDKRAYVDVGDRDARVGTNLEGRARWVRRTMTELLGAPVYEDEATAIYAPWEDGSPCPDGVGK
ncbi:MAG: hypothetical protein Q8P41_11900 [Pseudomonadota bacterium]|nr:hypothetical protein [Pseudomonadota bacterium]